jgi:glycosyltransferase involved in cell wall biosynthesis
METNVNTLFLFGHYYPDGMAMSKRMHLYAKSFIDSKESIYIAVWRKKSNLSFGAVGKTNYYDSVPFSYILDSYENDNRFIKKIKSLFIIFSCIKYLFVHRDKYSNLFVISFGWLDLYLLSLFCNIFNKKIIIEVNELPYSYHSNLSEFKILNRINLFFTCFFVYPRLDGFIVISENLKNFVKKNTKPSARVIKIPILIDELNKREIIKSNEKPYIFHAGTLNEQKDGIIEVFESFALAHKKLNGNLRFILTNRNTNKDTLVKIDNIIKKFNLHHDVEFLSFISNYDLINYFKKCSIVIVNRPLNRQNLFNFSTKLAEYLSHGIPVICTAYGEAENYMKDDVNCVLINNLNSEQIADCIVKLLKDINFSNRISNEGFKLARDNFHYSKYSYDIINFFKSF